MGNLGLSELLVIFIVALVVIGPKRLPEVARALGQAARAFQDALQGRDEAKDTRTQAPRGEQDPDARTESVARTDSDRV